MMAKTVFVAYRGKGYEVTVPCNGKETFEELQARAKTILRQREMKRDRVQTERFLKSLELTV
jgi:hypothetical protein